MFQAAVGYERAEQLFPFVLLTLVVPLGLLDPRHTRKSDNDVRYRSRGASSNAGWWITSVRPA